MARRLFSAAMIVALIVVMVVPCFAVDNTIGVVQQDLDLLGMSIASYRLSSLSMYDYVVAENGVITKLYTSSALNSSLSSYPYMYFVFSAPSITISTSISGYLVFSAPDFVCDSAVLYGGNLTSGRFYFTKLSDISINYTCVHRDLFSLEFDLEAVDLSGFEYLFLMLHNTNEEAVLNRSISFSESIGAQSVSLSPSSSTQTTTSTLSMSGVKSSGTIDIGSTYSYANAAMGGAYAANYGILELVEYNGATYVTFNGTTNLDKALPNIRSSASLSGTATLSGSSSTVSYSGTSSATTGTITASASSDVMAYGLLSATYGDDGGLVDEVFDQGETLDSIEGEVFDQGETLDDIAGDMQEIIDDMEAKSDTANDIGSATSEDTITGTQETLNSGTDALSSGLTVAGDVASVSAPAGMYIGLLTTTVTPMLNFGNGVLYWALFAVVIGSVILFLLRRLQ